MSEQEKLKNEQLGQLLLAMGTINPTQLDAALAEQRRSGDPLGHILLSHQWIESAMLMRALRHQTPVTMIDLDKTPPQPEALALVSRILAWRHDMVPVSITAEPIPTLTLAAATAVPQAVLRAIERSTGRSIRMRSASSDQIRRALERYYPQPARDSASARTAQGTGGREEHK